MTTPEIRVIPPEAMGVLGGHADTFTSGAASFGGFKTDDVDSDVAASLERHRQATQGHLSSAADATSTGKSAAGAMGDSDESSSNKVKGTASAGESSASTGRAGAAPGGSGFSDGPRMTSADLAKAAGQPYQSSMPMSQTASQMAQALPQALSQAGQQIPGMLQAPLQGLSGVAAPFQQMLQGPGGGQMLDSMLAKAGPANGFDGGPASLALAGGGTGDAARLNGIAKSVLGIPYAWGGGTMSGPSQGISDGGGPADRAGDYRKTGFDCSGLARYVTGRMYGLEIPRTSEAQYGAGMAVSAVGAQPGDLVFPASAGRPPGHVQIYLGGGQVLEAPSSGQTVKVSSLQSGSDFRRFHS